MYDYFTPAEDQFIRDALAQWFSIPWIAKRLGRPQTTVRRHAERVLKINTPRQMPTTKFRKYG